MTSVPTVSPAIELLDKIERAEALDKLAGPVRSVVNAVLGDRAALRDLLHGVWLGHPLHPMLVQVPIGAWTSAAVLDFTPGSRKAADRLIAVGVLSAVPAAVSGFADWSQAEPEQTRVGVVHWAANAVGVACYVASLAARRRGRRMRGKLLALAGLGAASVGGFIGGDLAYRQAMGANHVEDVRHTVSSGWHPVGELADLPDGEPARREVDGHPVLVVRQGETVHALADRCSHLGGPLHEGRLTSEGGERCIVCPWHASTFRLRDGGVVHGPATASQPAFRTRVVSGRVEVALGG